MMMNKNNNIYDCIIINNNINYIRIIFSYYIRIINYFFLKFTILSELLYYIILIIALKICYFIIHNFKFYNNHDFKKTINFICF